VELTKLALLFYKVAITAWTAEHEGVLLGIKQAAKTGKPSDALKAKLAQLEHEKPQAPRVPKLIHGNETPENLAWSLARDKSVCLARVIGAVALLVHACDYAIA
jgi:putative DNA primase/helicase